MKKKLIILSALVLCWCLAPAAAPAKEIRLALFVFEMQTAEDLSGLQAGIATMLPARLAVPGEIAVIEPQGAQSAAGQKLRAISAEEKLALAKKAGADYLLSGSITKLGTSISIDARLVSVAKPDSPVPIFVQSQGMDGIIPQLTVLGQKARDAIYETAGLSARVSGKAPAGSLAGGDEQYGKPRPRNRAYCSSDEEPQDLDEPPAPVRPRGKPRRFDADKQKRAYAATPAALFEQSPALSYTMKGKPLSYLCAGDVNGDGAKELIAAGADCIYIFQISGATLTQAGEIKTGMDEHVVHVDAGDFNGNGIDEIYASCYETQNARSFVVEFQQNQYVRTAQRQRWFYRSYRLSDGSVKLIGQEAGTTSPFSGDIYVMEWKDGKLGSREQFLIPGAQGIYSFSEGDIDADGVTDFLVFDKAFLTDEQQLIMTSTTGKTVWRDTQKLGGSPNCFTKYMSMNEMERSERVPLRIIPADIVPDGRWAVIVGRNYRRGGGEIASALLNFNEGRLECLLWDGSDLKPAWSSPAVSDYVADYLFDDFDKNGSCEIVLLSVESKGLTGSCANRFAMYRPAKK